MLQPGNKNQQRSRTMSVFINNCLELMEEEGIENLSIRKVAKKAGYNSATIYHYFDDFEELIVFACLKYVNEYANDLSPYLNKTDNYIEKYINIWECFCKHSFRHPREFKLLYSNQLESNKKFSRCIAKYYEIYPDDASQAMAEYTELLDDGNLYDREFKLLSKCFSEAGYKFPPKEVYEICEMCLLMYRGLISLLIESPETMTPEKATEKLVNFVKKILETYIG